MRLQTLDLKLDWPNSVPIDHLRHFVLEKLNEHGEPLRWAITKISVLDNLRQLNIEAVVLIK